MKDIRVQYLLTFEKDSICKDEKRICELFQVNPDTLILENILNFKEVTYQIELNKVKEDDGFRYFQLDIISNNEDSIEKQADLLRTIRRLTSSNKGKIEVHLDEMPLYYSRKAIPLIYLAEKELRQLITLFLIHNIGGLDKARGAIPKCVEKEFSNDLSDFNDLSEILPKNYSNDKAVELFGKIRNANEIDDHIFEELKSNITKSNFDKSFKDFIDFDADYLKKKCKLLNELRYLVFNNNYFTKTNFDELNSLISDFLIKNGDILQKIDSPTNRESILEFIVGNSSPLLGGFIIAWKNLEQKLSFFSEDKLGFFENYKYIDKMTQSGYLTNQLSNDLGELNVFRNRIVHLAKNSFSNDEILLKTETAKRIKNQILISATFDGTWPFKVNKGIVINRDNSIIFRHENIEY